MAHGKIRVNTLTYDTGSGDVDVAVSNIATGTVPTNSDIDARITAARGVTVQAFDADNAVTDAAQTFTAGQRATTTALSGTSFTMDMAAGNNFKLSTTGNWTAGNLTFSNITQGQCGSIFIVYGGAHSGPFPDIMKFPGGEAGITLTSTANSIDRIDYVVMDATSGSEVITCNFTANYVA